MATLQQQQQQEPGAAAPRVHGANAMRRTGMSPRALRDHADAARDKDGVEEDHDAEASVHDSLLAARRTSSSTRCQERANSLSSYLGFLGVLTTALPGSGVDPRSAGAESPAPRRHSWPVEALRETQSFAEHDLDMENDDDLADVDDVGLTVQDGDSADAAEEDPCDTPLGSDISGAFTSDSESAYQSVQASPTSADGDSDAFSPYASEPSSAKSLARICAKVNPDGTPMTKEEELEAMYNAFAAHEPARTAGSATGARRRPSAHDDDGDAALPEQTCSAEAHAGAHPEVCGQAEQGDAEVEADDEDDAAEDDDCCFICMAPFCEDDESERIELPCIKKCNKSPVHAKCIFEWREHRNNTKEASGTCPLCRGPLDYIKYLPPDPLNRASFVLYEARRHFVQHPVPREHGTVRCFVRVTPSGWLGINSYEMFIQAPCALPYPQGSLPLAEGPVQGDQLLLCARKRMPTLAGNRVDITLDRSGKDYDVKGPNYIGHVHSNLLGLEHTLVQPAPSSDKRAGAQELACVVFGQNRIGMAMGPRKMRVCIPTTEEHEDDEAPDTTAAYRPSRKKDTMANLIQSSTPENLAMNQLVQYGENREPSWLESIQAYSLDFYGRVTLPSNKNFQLCLHDDPDAADTNVLQFGKVVSHESNDVAVYTLDFQYPISPLQAFGLAISAADRKLMCA